MESAKNRKALKLSLFGLFLLIKSLPEVPFTGIPDLFPGNVSMDHHQEKALLSLFILQDMPAGPLSSLTDYRASVAMDAHSLLRLDSCLINCDMYVLKVGSLLGKRASIPTVSRRLPRTLFLTLLVSNDMLNPSIPA